MKKLVPILILLIITACAPLATITHLPVLSGGAAPRAIVNPGLRKFHRGDFLREPKKFAMSDAAIRKMPGYGAAIDASGNIRLDGKHVIAVVSPNAPPAGAASSALFAPSLPLDGQNYHLTSDLALFPPTISVHDVHQGQIADCYFLAPLAAMAHMHPEQVPLQIVRESTNQYRARFKRGADAWVRVDSSLPTNADTPFGNSNWVAIYEKAYAYYRTGANTYASLNWGYAGLAFSDLGYGYIQMAPGPATDAAVATALSRGMPVCIMTNVSIPAGVPLIGSHSEAVMSFDGTTYSIYNPWGFDGAGADSNPWDGCVSLSLAQARSGGINCFVICNLYTPPSPFVSVVAPPAPIPGDANGDGVVNDLDAKILTSHFGQSVPAGAAGWALGDFNGNGTVDLADFTILSQHYGQHAP